MEMKEHSIVGNHACLSITLLVLCISLHHCTALLTTTTAAYRLLNLIQTQLLSSDHSVFVGVYVFNYRWLVISDQSNLGASSYSLSTLFSLITM